MNDLGQATAVIEHKASLTIDDVKAQLGADAAFVALSDYQLLLSREQSSELRRNVEAVVAKVEESLDRITREADRDFNLRRKAVSHR